MTGEKEDLRGERRRFEKSELYLEICRYGTYTHSIPPHILFLSFDDHVNKNRDSWKNIQSQKSIEINPIL
jgi:hypothetical protein